MVTFPQKLARLSRQERKERQLWVNVVGIIFDVAYHVHGMDDKTLAKKAGVSASTLYRLWNEEFLYIHTTTLSKLFSATGLSFEAFREAGVAIPGKAA